MKPLPLLPRVASWARSMLRGEDMSLEWSCCGAPERAHAEAPASADRPVYTCVHCGQRWADMQGTPGAMLRWKPVYRETRQ